MEFILNDFDYLIRGRAESTLLARRGYLFIGSIWVCCGAAEPWPVDKLKQLLIRSTRPLRAVESELIAVVKPLNQGRDFAGKVFLQMSDRDISNAD